jgi:hypothetical protein
MLSVSMQSLVSRAGATLNPSPEYGGNGLLDSSRMFVGE